MFIEKWRVQEWHCGILFALASPDFVKSHISGPRTVPFQGSTIPDHNVKL